MVIDQGVQVTYEPQLPAVSADDRTISSSGMDLVFARYRGLLTLDKLDYPTLARIEDLITDLDAAIEDAGLMFDEDDLLSRATPIFEETK